MRFDLKQRDFVETSINSQKLAVCGCNAELTWDEFHDEVAVCKRKILDCNLPQGHPVVIYGHKHTHFVVWMTACMSLGLPYIPLDTIYPPDRVEHIIATVQSAFVVNALDNTFEFNPKNASVSYWADDPIVYIIFTSGSTGEPKGVQITRDSLLDFTQWLQSDFNFSCECVFMNQAPFSFDLSVYELMGFLSFGGTIVLNSREIIQTHLKFFKRIQTYGCNIWVSTPSFIGRYLLSAEFTKLNLSSLTTFLFCGEVLQASTVKRILKHFPQTKVLNTYGPTEATVATTLIHITLAVLEKYPKNLPVGYVKKGSSIHLLNKDCDNMGEMEIVGENVSIGYFNNALLNEQKFGRLNHQRSFKTGDFGYYEGELLFFANRKDDLIKLHGFRIELGEIDKAIGENGGIHEALTLPLKKGEEVVKLITFITTDSEVDLLAIKAQISLRLPYYMVPSEIIPLEKFPYNNNHKIDKNSLISWYKNR